MDCKRYMSRDVSLLYSDGKSEEYRLAIVDVFTDDAGNIVDLKARPFDKEEAGVTYSDEALRFLQQPSGKWVCNVKLS